jgi:hypothetical protein
VQGYNAKGSKLEASTNSTRGANKEGFDIKGKID